MVERSDCPCCDAEDVEIIYIGLISTNRGVMDVRLYRCGCWEEVDE